LGGAAPGVVTLHDWSRYENDGAMTDITWEQSAAGLWVPVFNGATSVSNHGTDDSLINISPSISVFAWVNAAPPAATQSVASKFDDTGSQRSWDLGASAGGGFLSGFISDDGTVGGHCKSYYSSIVVYDSTWHQVGMVFKAGTFNLFIDGVVDPAPTKSIDDAITTIYYSTTATCIGSALHTGATMWEFEGLISQVRVYNYAITPAQIRARYHSTRWLFGDAT